MASDEAARNRLVQYDNDRRNVVVAGPAHILGRPAPDEVADAIWALVSPEVFTLLTDGRGWTIANAKTWLVTLCSVAFGACSELITPVFAEHSGKRVQ